MFITITRKNVIWFWLWSRNIKGISFLRGKVNVTVTAWRQHQIWCETLNFHNISGWISGTSMQIAVVFFLGLLSILLFLHADKTIRTHLFRSSFHSPPSLWKAESNESWISFFVHFASPKCSQGCSINTNFKSILEDLAMPPLFLKQGLSCVGSAGLGVGLADLWGLFPPQQFCNFPHTFWVLHLFCCYFNRNKKSNPEDSCASPL